MSSEYSPLAKPTGWPRRPWCWATTAVCWGKACATAAMVPAPTSGMSAGNSNQPGAWARACTPAAMVWPMPLSASCWGITTRSRRATTRAASGSSAGVVTTTQGSRLSITCASVVPSTVEAPSACTSLWDAPANRLPRPAAITTTTGRSLMERASVGPGS